MKCEKCGYSDNGTGDWAHVCGPVKVKHYSNTDNPIDFPKSDGMNERIKEYDVVVDVLQKHREKLWMMTNLNMNADSFNIMDQIRLEQIDQLDKAIIMWLNSISELKNEL